MNTEREKWIDEVLGSTKGKTPASATPFLYEKVMFRVQKGNKTENVADRDFVYKWAAVIVLLIGINGVAIVNALSHKHHSGMTHEQSIFSEMESSATYNY